MSTAKNARIGRDLTEGPIMSTLLSFAIPIVLTNLVQQLYSMVDLVVIGKFVGTVGTVGVNVGGEMADLVTPLAIGFSTAGQIYIAQLFGAGDEKRVSRTTGTLLTFMLLLSCVLAALTIIFSRPLLQMLNCPDDAMGQASAYMIITALGMPFIFGYNAVVGVLRGIGESKKPLIFILVAASVNIVLDIFLVVVIPLEAAGTAIATVMSQLGSFIAAFIFMWRNRDKFDFRLRLSYFRMDKRILWKLVRLGIPQVIRSLLVRFSMLWINATANGYGMVVSATNSVGNKLQKFLEVFIQGVDTASAAMIGQNLGAGKVDRAGKVTWCTLFSSLICAVLITALCLLCPKFIFGIFTDDAEVLEMGVVFLQIMVIHVFATAVLSSFQGMVTGCGHVNLNFAIGTLDGVVCKVCLVLLFVHVFDLGYIGLFLGNSCSRILSAVLYAAYFLSGRWRKRRLLTAE